MKFTKEDANRAFYDKAIRATRVAIMLHSLSRIAKNSTSSWERRKAKLNINIFVKELRDIEEELKLNLSFIKEVPKETLTKRLK